MVHDACGVGFIADLRCRSTRDIVDHGLTALRRMTHRGASADLGAVDGCGLMTAIPWTLLDEAFGGLPALRTRALGMAFVHPSDSSVAMAAVEGELRKAGAIDIRWREVPTDPAVVLPAQRASTPRVLQFVAGFHDSAKATAVKLYRVRLRIERAAREASLTLTIASLSTTTVVYKGLVTPAALDVFYPDLAHEGFTSSFVVCHQRFSTNTSANWALAQPFRTLAHNGEINTIRGNRLWMHARLADRSIHGLAADKATDPISVDGSDSRTLDDAVELMRHHGYSLAHALSRLVPPAWERDRDLAPDVRAFYEFQSLLSEPWDGPSALMFSDGRYVGAALDRNGFRPARIVKTAAGLIAVASEVGVLASDEHDIIDRGRLGPGEMVIVDLHRGAVMGTNEIRRKLAYRRRYRQMVGEIIRPLTAVESDSVVGPTTTLEQRQAAFGCTREEIELLLKPMIAGGHEAVGSMGDDTPPAVLSSRSRLFTDYFRQRFAQVTNPPVDPYREASVMSLSTTLGGHGSFLDEVAPRPRRITLRSPILTESQLAGLRGSDELAPVVIETLFDAAAGAQGFEQRLDEVVNTACEAVEQGKALLVLTDRGVSAARAPLPALLVTAAVHHALVRRGLRMGCSLVVDSGDVRDAHQLAVLCAYGASAVHPWLGCDTVDTLASADATGCHVASARYRLALERGLLTVMSKMGVCTFSGYCGAQLVEILGLDRSVA